MRSLLLLLLSLISSSGAFAYPEFIGYGYNSCMACHYNGAGGGGLTDYGRALYASELAARPFWSKQTDDQLAESSNFLGKKASPFWLKPGLKFRRLLNMTNPGSTSERTRAYVMQADLNLAFFTSEEADRGMIVTISHVPERGRALPNEPISPDSEIMLKEYYLRWGLANGTWLYVGMFDKPFGIRHPDHTAVNRAPLRLGQNDQVHGVKWHRPLEKSDLFIHAFLGNLHQAGEDQSRGLSVFYEQETRDRFRPGVSVRTESSRNATSSGIAGHLRAGLEKGHAFLYELGLQETKVTGLDKQTGLYQFMEFSYLLTRGYHFQSILQMNRSSFGSDAVENDRWGFGLLGLPFQRAEFRVQALQLRRRDPNTVKDDQWLAQAQLHFSL